MKKKSEGAISRLLTAQDVAELLSINESTVYKWTDQGRLPYIDLSNGSGKRCLRFHKTDMEKFIKERVVQVK